MDRPREGSPAPRSDSLRGFRIGVTSDRRSDDLISALERRGARVLHAPALRIAPHDQDGLLVDQTREVIAARPEVVAITTGYGMRRWLEVADTAGLGADLVRVLQGAHTLARGPKALGAVRAAGLDDAEMSEHETTASIVDRIIESGRVGRRVVIQLHGYTDEAQLSRLRAVSERVLSVTPYRWVKPTSSDAMSRLIAAVCNRELDVVTFTSAPGADATLDMARSLGQWESFVSALNSDVVAAVVGPVTARPLLDAGVTPVQPERYRMGALIRLVCDYLEVNRVSRWRSGETDIEVRGREVEVQGRTVLLGLNAAGLLRTLAESGSVVSRRDLVAKLPEGGGEHALDVAVSRLRRALGVPDLIVTVVKRGYRLNATRLSVGG